MSKATLVMVLAGCSLFNASCFAASISEQLENKLNICRQEYKDLVATTNEELRKLKEKAPSNFPTIYKQKQNKLKQKADSCKKLKNRLKVQRTLIAGRFLQNKLKQFKNLGLNSVVFNWDKTGLNLRLVQNQLAMNLNLPKQRTKKLLLQFLATKLALY